MFQSMIIFYYESANTIVFNIRISNKIFTLGRATKEYISFIHLLYLIHLINIFLLEVVDTHRI